jgi:hypothetical protein
MLGQCLRRFEIGRSRWIELVRATPLVTWNSPMTLKTEECLAAGDRSIRRKGLDQFTMITAAWDGLSILMNPLRMYHSPADCGFSISNRFPNDQPRATAREDRRSAAHFPQPDIQVQFLLIEHSTS